MNSPLRKTRFVCLSDTHNACPADGSFKLPKGDVLIHAGDLTKQGTFSELKKTLEWIEKADYEVKIVVAGNHDISLDPTFYEEHGLQFHNQNPQDLQTCIDLIKKYPSITYLNHESTHVYLKKEDGPRTCFRVFGSPYSPAKGLWAFGYPPEHASFLWDQIPLDTDVVVTHTPPKYHCDESRHSKASGCETLRETLWRIRPSLAICGHIHEGRGAERILWDLDCPNVKFKESATGYWADSSLGPGNKKQCLLDLSAKSMAPLNSTGSWVRASDQVNVDGPADIAGDPLSGRKLRHTLTWTSGTSGSGAGTSISGALSEVTPSLGMDRTPLTAQNLDDATRARSHVTVTSAYDTRKFSCTESRSGSFGEVSKLGEDRRRAPVYPSLGTEIHSATRGQGGSPPSGRCDLEALAGRGGRKETCVINASLMASSWPYKFKNSTKYNKPIMVDIDLPGWQESE